MIDIESMASKVVNIVPAGQEFSDSDEDGFEFGDESHYTKTFNSVPKSDYKPNPKNGNMEFIQIIHGDTFGDGLSSLQKNRGGFGKPSNDPKEVQKPYEWRRQNQADVRPAPIHGGQVAVDDYRMAVMKGNLPAIKQFINQGVAVDHVMKSGWTALMYAANCANSETVSYLLELKAEANYNKDKYSVLMAACAANKDAEDQILQCVTCLIEHGADVNAFDRHHMSPLMYAAREGRATVIKKLLANGANINKQDNRGWTALVLAASKGHILAVRMLLDNKADLSLQCSDGQRAEDVAISLGHDQIADLLSGKVNSSQSATVLSTTGNDHKSVMSSRSDSGVSESSNQDLVRYGDLELFLFGLELGSLVPVFQEHCISFSSFLKMTDEDLQKIGVSQLGVRKKILNAIRDTHKKEWEPSSLPSVQYNKTISAIEAVSMTANICKHTDYMASSFAYIEAQLLAHPEILQSQQDGVAFDDLCKHADQTVLNIKRLYEEVVRLRAHVTTVKGKGDYRPADLVRSSKQQNSGFRKRKFLTLAVLSGVTLAFWKRNTIFEKVMDWISK